LNASATVCEIGWTVEDPEIVISPSSGAVLGSVLAPAGDAVASPTEDDGPLPVPQAAAKSAANASAATRFDVVLDTQYTLHDSLTSSALVGPVNGSLAAR
jgi:hypothetical protein